jgi:hypothetical protein
MTLLGACLAVLFTALGVPEVKVAPFIAASVLGLTAGVFVAVYYRGDLLPLWAFPIAVLATNALYGPFLWQHALPELGKRYRWFFRETFFHPGRLRDAYRSQRTG